MQLGTNPANTNEQVIDIEPLRDFSTNSVDYVFISNFDGTISYYKRGSNPLSWTLHTIPESNVGYGAEDTLISKNLYVTNFNGIVYVFYIGGDGYPQFFSTVASSLSGSPTWRHSYLGAKDIVSRALGDYNNSYTYSNTKLHFDNGVLYYVGRDGYMHRYYWDNEEWRHSVIVPCSGQTMQYTSDIVNWHPVSDNGFVYEGAFNKINEQKNAHNCQDCRNSNLPVALKQSSRSENGRNVMRSRINSEVASGIKVYPNPASDIINIEVADEVLMTGIIKLTNSIGIVVKELSVVKGTSRYQLNVKDLAPGFYYMNIYDQQGKQVTVQKISLF